MTGTGSVVQTSASINRSMLNSKRLMKTDKTATDRQTERERERDRETDTEPGLNHMTLTSLHFGLLLRWSQSPRAFNTYYVTCQSDVSHTSRCEAVAQRWLGGGLSSADADPPPSRHWTRVSCQLGRHRLLPCSQDGQPGLLLRLRHQQSWRFVVAVSELHWRHW